MMRQYWRVGGACALLLLVMFIIGAVIQGGPPMFDDSVEDIRAYWVDHGNDYLVGDYIIGLGFILFFFPFLSSFRSLLGAAEGGMQTWSRVVFAGGILLFALAGASSIFWTALAWGDVAENASDETIQTLMWLDVGAVHFMPAGMAIMALAAALVILVTKVLPLWYGLLTLVYGVIALLSMLSILSDNPDDSFGWIAFPASAIWLLVTGILLLMKKDAPMPGTVAYMEWTSIETTESR
jgi:hypothetical protein